MVDPVSRRDFVEQLSAVAATWLLAGSGTTDAAGEPRTQETPPRLRFFDAAQAREIEAAASRIIPSDDGPGAREAGVIHYIDRGLATFAKDQQTLFRDGLATLATTSREKYPQAARFSALTEPQQDEILRGIEKTPFFEALRASTFAGMFALPSYGGNRDFVGWKAIGMDTAPVFTPPFGYYDRPSVRRSLLGRSDG